MLSQMPDIAGRQLLQAVPSLGCFVSNFKERWQMYMKKWKVFYRDEKEGLGWEVDALTQASAILAIGNSEGLDFASLDACEVATRKTT